MSDEPPADRGVDGAWLSTEFVAAAEALARSMAPRGRPLGPFEVVVTGGPLGEVSGGSAGAAEAQATLSLAAADAWAILSGELAPSVAFMRGVLKTAGDPGLVLDVLALSATDVFESWRKELKGTAER